MVKKYYLTQEKKHWKRKVIIMWKGKGWMLKYIEQCEQWAHDIWINAWNAKCINDTYLYKSRNGGVGGKG